LPQNYKPLGAEVLAGKANKGLPQNELSVLWDKEEQREAKRYFYAFGKNELSVAVATRLAHKFGACLSRTNFGCKLLRGNKFRYSRIYKLNLVIPRHSTG
jgi:hypothetical protein